MKYCIDCKFYQYRYNFGYGGVPPLPPSLCGEFCTNPEFEEDLTNPVQGIRTRARKCEDVRNNEVLCGLEGKGFIPKSKLKLKKKILDILRRKPMTIKRTRPDRSKAMKGKV